MEDYIQKKIGLIVDKVCFVIATEYIGTSRWGKDGEIECGHPLEIQNSPIRGIILIL